MSQSDTTPKSSQFSHGLAVPLNAEIIPSPIVQYGGGMTAIHFIPEEAEWGRITFEKLDSIRVSRGEYAPFPPVPGEESSLNWVTTISNSKWLQERYEYEKKHYGSAYNWGGNVDEMLTDYSHYVFEFHDQFVEALAAGIWFEVGDTMLGDRELDSNHPLRGLKDIEPSERFEEAGITCQIRRNPLSEDELKSRARLCSQTILEVAAELGGYVGTDWSVTLRNRDGNCKVYLWSSFGNPVATFDEIPKLALIRPIIDKWLRGIREHRRKMGKA